MSRDACCSSMSRIASCSPSPKWRSVGSRGERGAWTCPQGGIVTHHARTRGGYARVAIPPPRQAARGQCQIKRARCPLPRLSRDSETQLRQQQWASESKALRGFTIALQVGKRIGSNLILIAEVVDGKAIWEP